MTMMLEMGAGGGGAAWLASATSETRTAAMRRIFFMKALEERFRRRRWAAWIHKMRPSLGGQSAGNKRDIHSIVP
ncbi:hypothetical protein [Aquabacterium commune]|uniref:hypothetical protein n=1 Tax=Aquabacterium commune TaxID=70586 RepID=UPI003BAFBB0C